MVSAAASARANLIESKQQINILEAHSKRLSQERESLSSQVTLLKVHKLEFLNYPSKF